MASPLQHITRRLPYFISEPASKLITQECYTTLVYNTDFGDTRCLRLAVSKGLGLGIVVGGGIVKVPQILKIVRHKSARGLSLSSYLLDTASLLLVDVYNVRLQFPFSTYGENIALTMQNVIITVLILAFSSKHVPYPTIGLFLVILAASTYALSSSAITPIPLLRTLVAASIPLSLSAKVPQIVTNHRNKSTGQLSAFLVFNSLAGCLARVFTTATETGDATLWWGFASAAALNAVIAVQMMMYWRSDARLDAKAKYDESLKLRSPTTATSSRVVISPQSGKARVPSGQWARKAE